MQENQASESKSLEAARNAFDAVSDWIQFFALIGIAATAAFSFGKELWNMVSTGNINMGDLLLLFLYTEVIVMAKAAIRSEHEVLIAMPMAIAVVAMARYMVVSPTHDPMHQLMYAGAVLIVVLALFVWYQREWPKRSNRN